MKQVYVCTCKWSSKSRARAVIRVTVPHHDGKKHLIHGL